MRRHNLSLIIYTSWLFFGNSFANTDVNWKLYKNGAFSMEVPQNIACSVSPSIDFSIYNFKEGRVNYVHVYLGHQPDFPFQKSSNISMTHISGLTVETVGHKGNLGVSREYLFKNSDPTKPLLHIWYNDLTGDELKDAEHSIRSVLLK